jgi:uncharacterized protein YoxC
MNQQMPLEPFEIVLNWSWRYLTKEELMSQLVTLINDLTNAVSQLKLETASLHTNLHSLKVQNENARKKNVPEDLNFVIGALESNIVAVEHQLGELLKKIPPVVEDVKVETKVDINGDVSKVGQALKDEIAKNGLATR